MNPRDNKSDRKRTAPAKAGAKPSGEKDHLDELTTTKGWDSSLVWRLVLEVRAHKWLFAGSFGVLAVLFGLEHSDRGCCAVRSTAR